MTFVALVGHGCGDILLHAAMTAIVSIWQANRGLLSLRQLRSYGLDHCETVHAQPDRYMEKLAVGPSVNPRAVSLNKPIASNIRAVAEAKGMSALLGCSVWLLQALLAYRADASSVRQYVCREVRRRCAYTLRLCCVHASGQVSFRLCSCFAFGGWRLASLEAQCVNARIFVLYFQY